MTSKFRDAVASGHLPSIPTHTWSASPTQFSDSWQFSLVYPLLNRFIVTLQERTLWVLDPENIVVVGVLTLEHPITAIATCGSRIYVLCGGVGRPLARLSVHPAIVRAEAAASESRRQTEEEPEKSGLREKSEAAEKKVVVAESSRVDELTGANKIQVSACESPAGEREELGMGEGRAGDEEIADATLGSEVEEKERTLLDGEHEDKTKFPQKANIIPEQPNQKPSVKPRSNPTTPELLLAGMKVELRELREMKVLKPKLDKLSGMLHARLGGDKSRGTAGAQGQLGENPSKQDPESGRSSPQPKRDSMKLSHVKLHPDPDADADATTASLAPLPVDPQEQERRLRMAQALEGEGEGLVAASNFSPRRRRKKRKTSRKISSQSSELGACQVLYGLLLYRKGK